MNSEIEDIRKDTETREDRVRTLHDLADAAAAAIQAFMISYTPLEKEFSRPGAQPPTHTEQQLWQRFHNKTMPGSLE